MVWHVVILSLYFSPYVSGQQFFPVGSVAAHGGRGGCLLARMVRKESEA